MLNIISFNIRLLQSTNIFAIQVIFVIFLFAAPSFQLDSEIWFNILMMFPVIMTGSPIMALFLRPEYRIAKPFINSLPISKTKTVIFYYLLLFCMFIMSLLLTNAIMEQHHNFIQTNGLSVNIESILKYNLITVILPIIFLLPLIFKNKFSDKKVFFIFIMLTCNFVPLFRRLIFLLETIQLSAVLIAVSAALLISIYKSIKFHQAQELQC